jgi:hypothetical protein
MSSGKETEATKDASGAKGAPFEPADKRMDDAQLKRLVDAATPEIEEPLEEYAILTTWASLGDDATVDDVYQGVNFLDDGSPVRDSDGVIMPPIPREMIAAVIAAEMAKRIMAK